MDIKSIQPTAKFKFDLANGQQIEIEMGFVSAGLDSADYVQDGARPKFSKIVRGLLAEKVVSWDVTENGVPIPCSGERFQLILGLTLKDGSVLGMELLSNASNSENYLKN